jgi:hypothetical protein
MRYFIAFAATLGLLFLLLFLLFHGGKGGPKVLQTNRSIISYATTDAQAQLTIDGPINADQEHTAAQITIDNHSVTFKQLRGYQGTVINTQAFASNENAYANFLFALARAGFASGSNNKALSDERGYCPLGDRYVFQLTQDGRDIERYWATSCGGAKTYLGNLNLTLALFQAQVPSYGTLTQNILL